MRAEINNKFFVVSHVPEELRESFISELRGIFQERAFYGPSLGGNKGGLRETCIKEEGVNFS